MNNNLYYNYNYFNYFNYNYLYSFNSNRVTFKNNKQKIKS